MRTRFEDADGPRWYRLSLFIIAVAAYSEETEVIFFLKCSSMEAADGKFHERVYISGCIGGSKALLIHAGGVLDHVRPAKYESKNPWEKHGDTSYRPYSCAS